MTLRYGYVDNYAFMIQIPCPPGFLIQMTELMAGDTFHGRRVHQHSLGTTIIKLESSPIPSMPKMWQKWFVQAFRSEMAKGSWDYWRGPREHLMSLTETQLEDFFKDTKPKKVKRPAEPEAEFKLTGRPARKHISTLSSSPVRVIAPTLINLEAIDADNEARIRAGLKRASEIYWDQPSPLAVDLTKKDHSDD